MLGIERRNCLRVLTAPCLGVATCELCELGEIQADSPEIPSLGGVARSAGVGFVVL